MGPSACLGRQGDARNAASPPGYQGDLGGLYSDASRPQFFYQIFDLDTSVIDNSGDIRHGGRRPAEFPTPGGRWLSSPGRCRLLRVSRYRPCSIRSSMCEEYGERRQGSLTTLTNQKMPRRRDLDGGASLSMEGQRGTPSAVHNGVSGGNDPPSFRKPALKGALCPSI